MSWRGAGAVVASTGQDLGEHHPGLRGSLSNCINANLGELRPNKKRYVTGLEDGGSGTSRSGQGT